MNVTGSTAYECSTQADHFLVLSRIIIMCEWQQAMYHHMLKRPFTPRLQPITQMGALHVGQQKKKINKNACNLGIKWMKRVFPKKSTMWQLFSVVCKKRIHMLLCSFYFKRNRLSERVYTELKGL